MNRKVVLAVPYEEKNEAKALGARWDPDLRKWFVPAGMDSEPFARWFHREVPRADRAMHEDRDLDDCGVSYRTFN